MAVQFTTTDRRYQVAEHDAGSLDLGNLMSRLRVRSGALFVPKVESEDR